MQLELESRVCHLGNSMSTNTEKHGDEDIGAIDLPVDGLVLTASELDSLLGDGAHAALYTPAGDDDVPQEIRFPMLNPLAFKDHFEHAEVTLELAQGFVVTLFDAKVRKVKLTPQAGGLTLMACSVRALPGSEDVATLYDWLNHDATIEITGGKKAAPKGKAAQQDLALGEQADGEEQPENEAA